MNQQRQKVIKISALTDEITEITREQLREETRYRTQCAWLLARPSVWDHERKFMLSMIMVDQFSEFDPLNIQTTLIWRKLRSSLYTPTDIIQGDVYLSNETEDAIVDFSMEDFQYILRKLLE